MTQPIRLRGLALGLGGLCLCPLAAAAAPSDIHQGTASFAVGGALAVTALAVALWVYLLGRDALVRARRQRNAADRISFILEAAPVAHLAWTPEGHFAASANLAPWIGRSSPIVALDDLLDRRGETGFTESHFALIEEAAAAIRSGIASPRPFEVSARDRHFRVTASRAGDLALLWFTDITSERQKAALMEGEIARMAAENRLFRQIAEALPFPLWRRGADLALQWVNPAYVQAVEAASAAEVLEQKTELVGNLVQGGPRADAARALAEGAVAKSKHYVVINGQRRAITMVQIPQAPDGANAGADGNAAVVGYAYDSTELDDLRAEIARYAESHAETLNKLSTAVAIFGADKSLEFYNSAFVRLWQLPEEFLSTHPHHGELLEAMRERRRLPEQADFPAWKKAHLAYYTELLEPVEEMWHLPDEATLRVVTQPHPLGGLLIMYEDVTDRLALERSYNTLIAVQRATLNNLHEGVAVFGGDGRLRLHNPAFREIWRLDEEVLSDSPHLSRIADACAPLFAPSDEYELFNEALSQDDGERVARRGHLRRTDGCEIIYNAVPLPDGATLFTFLDVTDSVRIERALRERNEALEAADRLKTEFVAHISYELRTPLNSVIGFAELLDKEYYGPLNKQQRDYVTGILESSALLLVLINDILDLAVVEAGGMQLEIREFELGRMLASVAGMAREDLAKRRHKLHLRIPEGIGAIQGDERRIRQVMYNLLSNAMKFTPAPGEIEMGVEAEDADHVRLFVRDNGVGIPRDEQPKAFDRFHTGREVARGQGAGLGLSLVKSFVELHGGRVTLESSPGEGTLVTCILPRRQDGRQAEAAADQPPAAAAAPSRP